MFIDSLTGIIPPQSLEIKIDKKKDVEEPKPIKGSHRSDDARLEMAKQDIAKKNSGIQKIPEGDSHPGLNALSQKSGSGINRKLDVVV
ncbi:MAG: hypothetical protein JRF57_05365 [Deltaproteobacteria bacterium]|nr:hypothetical protein [Deltaproteobacteria bacterium]MBW2303124.1 hypothetical protein [Deltaproteobacteria bacterium]